MAKVKRYDDGKEKVTSAWSNDGKKRYGFVSKDRDREDPRKTRYGVGIDNMGSPYRGASDNEINTLLGNLDYGYDGDTVYAGFTPNFFAGREENPQETSRYIGYDNGDTGFEAGAYNTPNGNAGLYLDSLRKKLFEAGLFGNDGARSLGAYAAIPRENPNPAPSYGEANIPSGMFGFARDDGGMTAEFTPNNQHYIQALANLLRGQR